ncbi:hypothetical protein LFL97_23850 [Burkholderia sp. JSH-S8]|uniref:hypothetical protein n=1 Tax=Burkholderia stagnalis TaxID=1503054 RepID=UPI000F8051A3|nr:hypothetical protein [Burkholderia stagnalis]WGS45744.1 hypothetical protein LFL97_23850 [Burkholderia sp. JSH-S8]
MNVIVEYPEDCLLRPVERQVFSRQVRNLLMRDKAYMHDLDAMRARAGLEAAFHSYQREELATLLSMVHENVSDEVRDTLLERLGSYLNVRIRPADFTQETADPDQLVERGEPTHSWTPLIAVGIVMFAVGFGFSAAVTPSHPLPDAGTRSAVVTGSAPHANTIAQPLLDSTGDESVGDIPMLKFSFESSRPKRDLGVLRALMPADDGTYTIDLTVTPVVAAPAGASRDQSSVRVASDEHKEPKKEQQ